MTGPAGTLETLLDEPIGEPRAACVFAHPHPLHGGSMHSKPVFHAAKAMVRAGIAVLRFNFRGVGASRGEYDGGPGEMTDYRAALDAVAAHYPDLPLCAAGYSFGSWVAWNVALDDPRVPLLIGVGLPVSLFDFGPARDSTQTKLLVHGELDEVIPLREVRRFYGALREPKELVIVDGAGHLFDGQTAEVGETLEGLLEDWQP